MQLGDIELHDSTKLPPLNGPLEQLREQFLENVASLLQTNSRTLIVLPRKEYLASRDEALGQLEHLVLALNQGLDGLYGTIARQRNARTPINALSDDILRIIFNLCVDDAQPQDAAWWATQLSEVCSRWYTVADTNGAMWSRFDMKTTEDSVKTFLARSRNYMKRLSYGAGFRFVDPIPLHTLKLLDGVMDSVVELEVALSDQRQLVSWLNNDLSRAPALHTLTLRHQGRPPAGPRSGQRAPMSADSDEDVDDEDLQDKCPILDLSGFVSKASNLRHLTLDGLRLPWKSSHHYHLTVLRIVHCITGTCRLDNDILALLRDLPQLEVLELSMASSSRTDFVRGRWRRDGGELVLLPCLHTLKLSVPWEYQFHLLEGLDTATPLCTLDLTIRKHHQKPKFDLEDKLRPHLCIALSRPFFPDSLPSTLLKRCQAMSIELPPNRRDVVTFTGHKGEFNPTTLRITCTMSHGDDAIDILKGIQAHHSLDLIESCELVSSDCPPHHLLLLADSFLQIPNVSRFSYRGPPHTHILLARLLGERRCLNLTSLALEMGSLYDGEDDVCEEWLRYNRVNWPRLKSVDITLGPSSKASAPEKVEKKNIRTLQKTLEGLQGKYPDVAIRGYEQARKRRVSETLMWTQVWPMLNSEAIIQDEDEDSNSEDVDSDL